MLTISAIMTEQFPSFFIAHLTVANHFSEPELAWLAEAISWPGSSWYWYSAHA
jgi:hypothetical protein